MLKWRFFGCILACVPVVAAGQPVAPAATTGEPAAVPARPACPCVVIPALTPVRIEVLATLSSETSKTGELFPIRLASPIQVEGAEVVPAGAGGTGQVVHAKKSGGSGAGGELIVAARWLDVDGRRLPLRSMQLSITGNDRTYLASAASAAIGPFALAVKGRHSEVPAGIRADAKVALPFEVPLRPQAAEAGAAKAAPQSSQGERK